GVTPAPLFSQKAKNVALVVVGIVLSYNLMLRDILILSLGVENAPPPAITYESISKLINTVFGV
ncbi:MAG: hypothetical protein ACRC9M_04095, partial [Aeromonas sp.]